MDTKLYKLCLRIWAIFVQSTCNWWFHGWNVTKIHAFCFCLMNLIQQIVYAIKIILMLFELKKMGSNTQYWVVIINQFTEHRQWIKYRMWENYKKNNVIELFLLPWNPLNGPMFFICYIAEVNNIELILKASSLYDTFILNRKS